MKPLVKEGYTDKDQDGTIIRIRVNAGYLKNLSYSSKLAAPSQD